MSAGVKMSVDLKDEDQMSVFYVAVCTKIEGDPKHPCSVSPGVI